MTNVTVENTLLAPTSPKQATAWQGAFWKVFSCACFAAINGIVRYLSGGVPDSLVYPLPVSMIIVFQNIFGIIFMLPWILKEGVGSLRTQRPFLHFIRVSTAVVGIYLWYLTLKVMPIAEGIALNFTSPIFGILGASLFLKEKITPVCLLSILLSLLGAFVISRPDISLQAGAAPVGFLAILPLSSAIAFTFNKLLTRKLANLGETPTALATYLLLLMAPVSLIPAVFNWVTPTLSQWPWLLLLGALAASAHLSFSKAYQLAEVSFLTPFGFSKFALSALIGYLAFSEFPKESASWLGIVIILLSIVLLGYKMPLYSIAKRFRSN